MGTTSKSDYNSAFAEKLRYYLLDIKTVSMTQLAKELGVKQQTVSQWANGYTTPALEHLKPLAVYFGISIDELVTGVAPDNEEFHLNTGLSNSAIEMLKRLNAGDIGNNKVIIEFLNVIIENMDSKFHSLSRLARLCMDYIVGAHEPLLQQDELIKEAVEGYEHLVHVDRPNLKNDDLDFETYKLTKDFEYFIEHLTKDPKTAERVRKVYRERNLALPDYSDSRFKPGVFFNDSVSGKCPLGVMYSESGSCKETSNSYERILERCPIGMKSIEPESSEETGGSEDDA